MQEGKKRVLIITYYWPPAAGSGVQRWLKFSKYLPEFGFDPIIFTPANPAYDLLDDSLLNEVPADLQVIKIPIKEPLHWIQRIKGKKQAFNYQHQVLEKRKMGLFDRLAKWVRANFFVPDPRVLWVKPAASYILINVLERYKIDLIITTGPPFSLHLLGLRLKNASTVPWIADFRDPWSDWDILHELGVKGRTLAKHRALELEVLKKADGVLTSSEQTSMLLQNKLTRSIATFTNGADLQDFSFESSVRPQKFRLIHAGRLYALRNAPVLWQALNELLEESEEFAANFELVLVGEVSSEVQASVAACPALSTKTQFRDYQAHEKIVKLYQESALLLLLLNQSSNSELIIPGKLFEYMAAQRRILMLGKPASPTAQIIQANQAGCVCDFDDHFGIKQYVMTCFEAFKRGEFEINNDIRKYDRKAITANLANYLSTFTK
jgi:glycosyltransferase involved in cell wall biosynthesis